MAFLMLVTLLAIAASDQAASAVEPHAGMMRYPDVSASQIVFVYADDLWVVPRTGGVATPLASPPGSESFPRFSSDGQTIAFGGNYDGNSDIYTVPVTGGVPHRVTYHGSAERLCDWTFDQRLVFAMNGLAGLGRQSQLFTTAAAGGLPKQMPVPYGGYGVVSGDGRWLAYTPRNRDFRTWKRYRGGWASDIWLFDLQEHTSLRMTDWEGTDTLPMWQGDVVYYLSDAGPEHRLNIWAFDRQAGTRQQITHFQDYDVKWPSNGPGAAGKGEIVFENAAKLYLLDLEARQANPVTITVPGDRPRLRPQRKDVSSGLSNWFVSPHGKRVLVESRGDIWSLPASEGSPRNLTRSSGFAEREPSWSPDGKWITYFSDESGEYQLMLRSATESSDPEKITELGPGFRYQPTWSPDSKYCVFTDHEDRFYLLTIESHELVQFDRINITGWRWGSPLKFSWSHDSRWLTYTRPDRNNMNIVMLYDVTNKELHELTQGNFIDYLPTFDRRGDFLYFFSQRDITEPEYEDGGLAFIYADTSVLHGVPLRGDVKNPFRVRSDEEGDDDEDKSDEDKDDEDDEDEDDDEDQDDDEKDEDESNQDEQQDAEDKSESDDDEEEPLVIEREGFERRAFRVPIERGSFSFLEINDEHQILYIRRGDENVLQLFDPSADKPEEKTVISDVRVAQITPDGKQLLVQSQGKWGVIKAAPDQKLEKTVVAEPMTVVIEPREEWRQVFTDAWRFMRDYFYDPNMHQVDWPAVRSQYEAMLSDCASRRDVGFVIGEMISELNAGHTYYRHGELDDEPSMPVGYLGVDFELDQGFYRVAKVIQGGTSDSDARSVVHSLLPEEQEAFRYLFAVNDVPIDTNKAPWAALEGLAGQTVVLTVGQEPDPKQARRITVKLLQSEDELRYRQWVEQNRQYVADKSAGKIGYIHVPDTGARGQRELFRQFYGQMNREALIIDERWNGGGNIADRFVELLNRPIYLHLFERYEHDWRVPTISHQGPKCMLINGESGSGGDIFPYLFRKAGLGKLIGMRTWGGVIGIAKNPSLIDGASVTVPFITFYETDGTLTMEGHGVDPDLEVVDDPALMWNGGDPQLDAAIKQMQEEIAAHPYVPAKRPPYPDRRGMGIREEHK